MIYLDSAATTLQKPAAVAKASAQAINTLASPGRGGHRAGMRGAETAFACRQLAAELFHASDPEHVVLTFNATHGLNIAINVLGSFVHTCRLQYLEFFSRFYEDGGKPFEAALPGDRYSTAEADREDDASSAEAR